ncbi:hypothetical protein MAH1_34410 [Sessilibacter sp. MAH1]
MNRGIAFILSIMVSFPVSAGLSRNNTVEWVVVSSIQSGHGYFVQFSNALPDDECASGAKSRVKFDRDDDGILSLLLTARASSSKVGFYYNTTTNLPNAGGHVVPSCEILNIWIEN